MAYICPGEFSMGSPDDEVGRDLDERSRQVVLTRGFHIATHEVSLSDYLRLMGELPTGNAKCDAPPCAVKNVSDWASQSFANALSAEAGLPGCYDCVWYDVGGIVPHWHCERVLDWATPYDCPGYRLPTEAEWERAARAGTTAAFSTGGNLLPGQEYDCDGALVLDNGTVLDDVAVYCSTADEHTGRNDPVYSGTKEPSPWGLLDMHGSLWEWCEDYYELPSGDNQDDPWVAEGQHRVLRGGSWYNSPSRQRSASREWDYTGGYSIKYGFRIAITQQPDG